MVQTVKDVSQIKISPYVVPGVKFEYMPLVDQRIKADAFIDKICGFYNIKYENIISRDRRREWAVPRFWAMYFIKKNTTLTLRYIGEIFSGRDHTTVIHAITTINDGIKARHDNEFKDQYPILLSILT